MNPSIASKGWRMAVPVIALAVAGTRFGFAGQNDKPIRTDLPVEETGTLVLRQDNLEPLSYDVDLQIKPDPYGKHTLSGKVDIKLKLGKMNPFLLFHRLGTSARSLASRIPFRDPYYAGLAASTAHDDDVNPTNPSQQIAISSKGLKITRAFIKVAKTEAELDEDNCRTIEANKILTGRHDMIALSLEGKMPANSFGKLTILYEPSTSDSWPWNYIHNNNVKNEQPFGEKDLFGEKFVALPHFGYHKHAAKFKFAVSLDPSMCRCEARDMEVGAVESVPGSSLKKYHFEKSTDRLCHTRDLYIYFYSRAN